MKKILSLVLVAIMVLSFAGCGSKDATKGMSAEEVLVAATEKSTTWESFEADMDMAMLMTIMGPEPTEITMKGTALFFMDPMRMKMTMDTSMGEDMKMTIEQYMVQEGDQFVTYQSTMGQWMKMVIDDPSMSGMLTMDPAQNMELFKKYLVGAEIVGEEKVNNMDALKIDLTVSFEMYKELIADNAAMDMGGFTSTGMLDSLAEVGDLTYTIWVEKETLQPVKYYMDFGDVMSKVGAAVGESTDMPAEMLSIYDDMEMTIIMTIKNIDNVSDFEIPQEALDAEEISMDFSN